MVAGLPEQALWRAELEANTTAEGGPCSHPALRRSSVAVPAPRRESLLQRATGRQGQGADGTAAEDAPLKQPGQRVCARCMGAGHKVCSGCKSVHYCSTDCQLAHWKAAHRAVCRKASLPTAAAAGAPVPGGFASVVIPATAAAAAGGDGSFVTLANLRQGHGVTTANLAAPMRNQHGGRRFMLKAQVPRGDENQGLGILMYDADRAYIRSLAPQEQPQHAAVAAVVRARGTLGGAKAYLWAAFEGAELRIHLDDVPPQTGPDAPAW